MATSSAAGIISKKKHDVFISFRGSDVRQGFLSHLHKALADQNIEAFVDEQLKRGEEISESLLKKIEESHIAVVIFSPNFAYSEWCLKELLKIAECKTTMELTVIPVFYGVDPTHVQDLTGSYGDAMDHHRTLFDAPLVENWGDVFKDIASLAGLVSSNFKADSNLIDETIRQIKHLLDLLNDFYPSDSSCDGGLVGINSRVEEVKSLLCSSEHLCIVGIWGEAGIGKTTLARATFDRIRGQFDSQCFVGDVREKSDKSTADDLRDEVVSNLFGTNTSDMSRKRLTRKSVVLVLDNVSDLDQIKSIMRYRVDFGCGSRVIVTSRDRLLLKNLGAEIYAVEKLDDHEALQLFCLNAFKKKVPQAGYLELSKRAVKYARGLPLAVEVLGSNLQQKSAQEWKAELEKLKGTSYQKLYKILRISYDGLSDVEKEMFLEIARFFKGRRRDEVESLLDVEGSKIGIGGLVEKALISISSGNCIQMHDLIQQMAKDIICEEKTPKKRRWLWDHEDTYFPRTSEMKLKQGSGGDDKSNDTGVTFHEGTDNSIHGGTSDFDDHKPMDEGFRVEDDFFVDDEGIKDPVESFIDDVDRDLYVRVRKDRGWQFIAVGCLNGRTRHKKEQDDSWMVTGSVPGGPNDANTIPSFLGHVAHLIYQGQRRDILKYHNRIGCHQILKSWYDSMDDAARTTLHGTRLGHIPSIMFENIDMSLISAFVERWQPDTNSFHLPFGEMTIMLHDVQLILGIPVEGGMIHLEGDAPQLKFASMEILGVADEQFSKYWDGTGVLTDAITHRCRDVVRPLHAKVAGWMWLMFGSCLFPDKSGNAVRSCCALEVKDELDSICGYAWGASVLAYLYRQLGIATRGSAKSLTGCLTLLQAWIYEYFPCFRPHKSILIQDNQPRACMWAPRREGKLDRCEELRLRIDQLTATEVTWMPYDSDPAITVPRTLFMGLIRYRDIIEPYMPGRVVRQLGYVQTIPTPILRPDKVCRASNTCKYKVEFSVVQAVDYWRSFPISSCISLVHFRLIQHDSSACSEDYMKWYQQSSHPYLINRLRAYAIQPRANNDYWVNRSAALHRDTLTVLRQYSENHANHFSARFEDFLRDFNAS